MSARAKTGALRLHLDAFSGIAGNMFLGALLDTGLSARQLREGLSGLGVPHKLQIRKVQRGALAAKFVQVQVPKAAQRPAKHGMHYAEIRRVLSRARLPAEARACAQNIFRRLAEAEARVHGCAVARVHFHEVGAVDALVDVTGAALALHLLGVAAVSASPPALGHGTVETAHGRLPLPAPATLELLRGIPVTPAEVAWETVTPTGAAILAECAEEFQPLPAMQIQSVGYGAGNARAGPLPNVLRAVLGRAPLLQRDRVAVLEANLDDFPPEHFEHVQEQLQQAGALDVSLQHIQMKRSRAGFLLRVIAPPHCAGALAARIMLESTTLGVRVHELGRLLLPRESLRVQCKFGRIGVKRSLRPDGAAEYSAEYADCKRAAKRHAAPLRDVIRAAEAAAAALPKG